MTQRVDWMNRSLAYRLGVTGAERLSHLAAHVQQRVAQRPLEVIEGIAYTRTGHPAQRMDVLYPRAGKARRASGVVYVHGGAFQYLSRNTHRHMASPFAIDGHVVFNLDYRLAPVHPYPACVQDVSAALRWIVQHSDRFGIDPRRLIIVGESAGAWISIAMVLGQCVESDEPWAEALRQRTPPLAGCIAACGVFDLAQPGWRTGSLANRPRTREIFQSMTTRFVDPWNFSVCSGGALASPMTTLEKQPSLSQPLPELFAFVGNRDPVQEDTTRLCRAYRRLGGEVEERRYPGENHAFHAVSLNASSRDAWRRQLRFARRRTEVE